MFLCCFLPVVGLSKLVNYNVPVGVDSGVFGSLAAVVRHLLGVSVGFFGSASLECPYNVAPALQENRFQNGLRPARKYVTQDIKGRVLHKIETISILKFRNYH